MLVLGNGVFGRIFPSIFFTVGQSENLFGLFVLRKTTCNSVDIGLVRFNTVKLILVVKVSVGQGLFALYHAENHDINRKEQNSRDGADNAEI